MENAELVLGDIELFSLAQIVARENMMLALQSMNLALKDGPNTEASLAVEKELRRRGILPPQPEGLEG